MSELQLNFLTTYDQQVKPLVQDLLFESVFQKGNNSKDLNHAAVAQFFSTVDKLDVLNYKVYWESITPKNQSEVFQRWLFAFLSVHTTWENNVKAYLIIKDWWEWINNWELLREKLIASGVGMQNQRVKYISEFTKKFWKNPEKYMLTEMDRSISWSEFRDTLKDDILGLGPAKVSFALEMIYPSSCGCVCLDTHMFKAYGLDQVKHHKQYKQVENAWLDSCRMWRVPPYIARCLYWDVKQGRSDSRYWSYVFEKK